MRRLDTLLIVTTACLLAATAFAKGPKKGVSPQDIGLRKAPLLKIAPAPPKTSVKGDKPGANRRYDKSYDDAPPMIPHAVADYVPIGLRNQCLACHTNPPKKYRSATVVPESHYRDRKGKNPMPGPVSVRKIYQGFYNCTMCHAPQKNAKPLVSNVFKGD